MSEIESVRKKFEEIDSDLNNFIQSIREIKEIRDSVGSMPDRLKQSENELENQRKDLDRMMKSSNNLLMTFEEQAKGIIFDLEKKTGVLTEEVRSSISQIGSILKENNGALENRNSEDAVELMKNYDELNQSFEILKNVVGDQQQTVNALKNDYTAVCDIFDKLEPSLLEMKKSISELQGRPSGSEEAVKDMEKRLMEVINNKASGQKALTISMFIVLLTGFLYFLFAFYLH
jgi:chromosome segregation ATPase